MLILCLKIFFVRIIDVSLGTIRTLFTVKGKKLIASAIGFVEVLVWFLVVKEALNTESNSIFIAISYALGFATGTYIGSFLSEILITGKIEVQVFTEKKDLVKLLRKHGYAVTVIDCKGYNTEAKYMLYISVEKKKQKELRMLIKSNDEKAFIVENEIKHVENGYFK